MIKLEKVLNIVCFLWLAFISLIIASAAFVEGEGSSIYPMIMAVITGLIALRFLK